MLRSRLRTCSAWGEVLKVCFLSMACAIVGSTDPTTVRAQQPVPGNITVFADAAALSCSITDQAPGPITLFVFHTNFSEMVTADFRVSESDGFHATYLGETIEPGHIGDFRGGILFVYGVCRDGPLLLGTISYQGHGTSESCSYVDVVGWNFPWPATSNCNFQDFATSPLGKMYVNPQPGACQTWCGVVPTTQATWGKIKALYRE